MKIFNNAMKSGLQLPKPKWLGEVDNTYDLNYSPYYKLMSYPIEDYYIFKDWVEKQYKEENTSLSKSVLSQQAKHANMVEIKAGDEMFQGQEIQEPSPSEAALENIP